jgi:hypothetical protein
MSADRAYSTAVANEGEAHDMQVEVRSRGIALAGAPREYVRRRLNFDLGRLVEHVRHIAVRLADVNEPRGLYELCRIQLTLYRCEGVLVEHEASDVRAVKRVATRVGSSLIRRFGSCSAPPWRIAASESAAGRHPRNRWSCLH